MSLEDQTPFQVCAHLLSFHLSNNLLRVSIFQIRKPRLSNLPKITQLVSEPVFKSRLEPQSLHLPLMPPQVHRCHVALRGWRTRSNQQCGECSDRRDRSGGVLPECPGLSQCWHCRAYILRSPPSWTQQDSLCPWSAFLCGPLSLLRRTGDQRTVLQLGGTFIYLRLYCVHIPGSFRACHQNPTLWARRRAFIQTSQDFLADGGSARRPLFWSLGSKSFRTGICSDPIPSVTSPREIGSSATEPGRIWKVWKRGDLATGLLGPWVSDSQGCQNKGPQAG